MVAGTFEFAQAPMTASKRSGGRGDGGQGCEALQDGTT